MSVDRDPGTRDEVQRPEGNCRRNEDCNKPKQTAIRVTAVLCLIHQASFLPEDWGVDYRTGTAVH